MLRRVHHVGLVVRRLEDGLAFWQDLLGLRVSKQASVRDQGVRAALRCAEIQHYALLAAVPRNPGGLKTERIAAGGLHFDHVGAEIRHDQGAQSAWHAP